MFTLKVAVILHGITLIGNLGSINYPYCDTIAKYLSGDNWVVTCSNGNTPLPTATTGFAYPDWTAPRSCSTIGETIICQ